jgi:hypothetical protein
VSFDLAFWESGDGSSREIYEDICDGEDDRLSPSVNVFQFRAEILGRWLSFADFVEPLDYDPDVDEQANLDRYVILAVPFSLVDELREVISIAHGFGLTVYDPQSEQVVPWSGGDS